MLRGPVHPPMSCALLRMQLLLGAIESNGQTHGCTHFPFRPAACIHARLLSTLMPPTTLSLLQKLPIDPMRPLHHTHRARTRTNCAGIVP
eukprot:scaffold254849_cov22-Tisochrysis_lutea.AAC.1